MTAAPPASGKKPTKKRMVKKVSKPKPKADLMIPKALDSGTKDVRPPDFGGYQLGVKLGQGAFGSVYQAFDTQSGFYVAVKTIALDRSPSALAGVQQEIELMSGLDHQHIVKYVCSHQTTETLYIVMEFAEGGSLGHVQKKFQSFFPEHLVAQYLYQVLLGLKYLHSQSIIHRDIKAANILLSNNIAKLADFGISIKLDAAKQGPATSEFSAYWTAPEVINQEAITELCDIWSLGITAIELFVGQPPWFELSALPALYKIMQTPQPPLPEKASPEFRDFLDSCLKRDVQFRKSADQLLKHRFIEKHNTPGVRSLVPDGEPVEFDEVELAEPQDRSPIKLDRGPNASSRRFTVPAFQGGRAHSMSDGEDADDYNDDDQYFRDDDSLSPVALPAEPSGLRALDELLDDAEETERQQDIDRQNNLFESVTRSIRKLLTLVDSPDELSALCGEVLRHVREEPFLRSRFAISHGVVAIVHVLQSKHDRLLSAAFPFIIAAGHENRKLHKILCILGILPCLFEYTTDPAYSESVQVQALTFLHQICTAQPGEKRVRRSLQMFISAGGLPKLAQIFSAFPHAARPGLTPLVLEIVHVVFVSNCSTPKSCFGRILMRADFLELLAGRYAVLDADDPSLTLLCAIFEIFATGDAPVKACMVTPDFIDTIFARASIGSPLGLNDRAKLSIFEFLRNLAMDTALVKVLWQGSLVDHIAAYLNVDRPGFQMDSVAHACFSTLFYMSRVITAGVISKLAVFLPAVILIVTRESPLKEFAATLFLECITSHSGTDAIRLPLRVGGVETLFCLMKTHTRKDQVMIALGQWCSNEPALIEKALCARVQEFVLSVAGYFQEQPPDVQIVVAKCVVRINDICPGLAAKLALSTVMGVLVDSLLGRDLSEFPQLRVALLELVVSFYEAAGGQAQLAAKFRIVSVVQKMLNDESMAVRPIAEQLQQMLISNDVL
jgi:serine/threonine protein kinase